MSSNLSEKYNVQGPRYTSYPAHPFWNKEIDQAKWLEHLNSHSNGDCDVYIHVPFCEKLCYYCGCMRIVDKSHKNDDLYVELILKEWKLYQEKIPNLKPRSIHLGGGTPTYLRPAHLKKLLLAIIGNNKVDISIEIDPRVTTIEHLKALKELGIFRVSLGIQDFDEKVQKAINRVQPIAMIQAFVKVLREFGIYDINFDLIYGLPYQDESSIQKTIDEVIKLKPTSIAFYSYAHVPWKIKNQKLVEKYPRLEGQEKTNLFNLGKKQLLSSNYEQIGLDHFALKESNLIKAQKNKTLKRNFMGYVLAKNPILIGLGMTSISSSGLSFVQNSPDLKEYQETLEKNELPLYYGHNHSLHDLVTEDLIHNIMTGIDANLWDYFRLTPKEDLKKIVSKLMDFHRDGLIKITNRRLQITNEGKPYLRNICMAFDPYLKKTKENQFSKTA